MKMQTIFTLFSFIVAALLAFTLVVFESAINRLETDSVRMREIAMRAGLAERIETVIRTHNRQAFLYLLTKRPEFLGRKVATRENLQELLINLSARISNDREREVFNRLDDEIQSYFKVRSAVESSASSPLEGYEMISREIDSIAERASELVDLMFARMDEVENSAAARGNLFQRAGLMSGSMSVILIFLGLIGSFWYLYRPILNVSEGLRKFSEGKLSGQLKLDGPVEIQKIARMFNKMANQLEQRKKEQVKFLASVAHDLKNPLNSILMSAEILIAKADDRGGGDDEKKILEIIRRQMKALDRLVGDLLDATRVEAGHFDLKLSFSDLGRILRDSVNLHRSSVTVHDIDLHLPDTPIYCYCDPVRISQVLNNLISNAIKYSPSGGVIEISARQSEDDVRILVSDQGMGIDPKDQQTIFEPFRRSESTKSTTLGIGLGLSTSRRIIEAHHGRIEVESEVGKGTTFTLVLPQVDLRMNNRSSQSLKPVALASRT